MPDRARGLMARDARAALEEALTDLLDTAPTSTPDKSVPRSASESRGGARDSAPEFHPPRKLARPPSYAARMRDRVAAETPNRIRARVANAAIRALHARLSPPERRALTTTLLRMFDEAILTRDLALASRLVKGVNALPASDDQRTQWLAEAVSETRLRYLTLPFHEGRETKEETALMQDFLRSCGTSASVIALRLLPNFTSPPTRRALSDFVLAQRLDTLTPIEDMLVNEQLFVVQEALYMLNRLESAAARDLESKAEASPRPEVRLASLRAIVEWRPGDAAPRAARLLRDPEPRIQSAAAQALGQLASPEAVAAIELFFTGTDLAGGPAEVARELFRAYGKLAQGRALDRLEEYVLRGDGLLAKRTTEDLAIAAMDGIMLVESPRASKILQRATTGRTKRLREAARARLDMVQGQRR